jgi:hypothetical protein
LGQTQLRALRYFPPFGQFVPYAGLFVGQPVGYIDQQDHVQPVCRNPAWKMVIGHRLHNRVGQTPKTKKVSADFGMGDVNQALFDFEEGLAFVVRLFQRAGKMRRRALGDDQFADVVEQGRKDDGRLDLRLLGDPGGNSDGELRVPVKFFEISDGNKFIFGERAKYFQGEHKIMKNGGAQANDGGLDIRDIAGETEESRIHQLEQLCAESNFLLDNLADALDGNVGLRQPEKTRGKDGRSRRAPTRLVSILLSRTSRRLVARAIPPRSISGSHGFSRN